MVRLDRIEWVFTGMVAVGVAMFGVAALML
jgi:hypothetical protein